MDERSSELQRSLHFKESHAIHTTLSGVAALATVLVNGASTVPAVAGSGNGLSVPCDTTALINAIATAPAGSTLVLARRCTYHLTTAYSGDDGLPPIDKQLTIEGRGSTIVPNSTAAHAKRSAGKPQPSVSLSYWT